MHPIPWHEMEACVWLHRPPAILPPRLPIEQEAEWAPEMVWTFQRREYLLYAFFCVIP